MDLLDLCVPIIFRGSCVSAEYQKRLSLQHHEKIHHCWAYTCGKHTLKYLAKNMGTKINQPRVKTG